MEVLDIYQRAQQGRPIEEKEFDIHVLPAKLAQLIEKYDIRYNPQEAIPQDLDMAGRVFEAAVDLLSDVGVYCRDTGRIVPVERDDIYSALRSAPVKYTLGRGTEAVEVSCRHLEDSRRPLVMGGVNGAPLSEENFISIMHSYAREPVDGLVTGAIQSLFGDRIVANTPVEFMACQYEALWAKEALRRAGKPGLSILGIMSGVSSESQNAGNFPGGLQPEDMHLVSFSNDLKISWDDLKKIAHHQRRGSIILGTCVHILGGYSGGPEGTAITGTAEALQGFVMARPMSFLTVTNNLMLGFSDKRAMWVDAMIPLAFQAARVDVNLGAWLPVAGGPCTNMICQELAAFAITATATGVSTVYGGIGCLAAKEDFATGMEGRIVAEVSRAAAGIDLCQAGGIAKKLVAAYQPLLESKQIPKGQRFTECYPDGKTPSDEYVGLWEQEKEKLAKMGLERIDH